MISSHAAAAKAIRAELKKNGIKGSVRSSSSKVSVNLENELPATVAAVASFADRYQMGHFDGMTDMYEYSSRNSDLPQVKFVFVSNQYSDEIRQAAWDFCKGYWADMEDAPESHADAWKFHAQYMDGREMISRALTETRGGFWATLKPRVAA